MPTHRTPPPSAGGNPANQRPTGQPTGPPGPQVPPAQPPIVPPDIQPEVGHPLPDVGHPPPQMIPPTGGLPPPIQPTPVINVIPKAAAELRPPRAMFPSGSPPRPPVQAIPLSLQQSGERQGIQVAMPGAVSSVPTYALGPEGSVLRRLQLLEDGDEVDPDWIPEVLPVPPPDFCFRFVRDGRHIPPARTAQLGPRTEIVFELPSKLGWTVRVPQRWTPALFERTFALGPYSTRRSAGTRDEVGEIITGLNDRLDRVERNLQQSTEESNIQPSTSSDVTQPPPASTDEQQSASGSPDVPTTSDGHDVRNGGETMDPGTGSSSVIKKTGLNDMGEVCRMVDHLLKNYSLRPAIHALWKQECTPEQYVQLTMYETFLTQGYPSAANNSNADKESAEAKPQRTPSQDSDLPAENASLLRPLTVAIPASSTSARIPISSVKPQGLITAVWHPPDYATATVPLPFIAALDNEELKEVPPKLMNVLELQFLVIAEAFDTQNKAVAQGFSHQNKEISKLHGQLWDVATGMEKLNEQNTLFTQQQVAAEQRMLEQTNKILESLNAKNAAPTPVVNGNSEAAAVNAFLTTKMPPKPLSFAEPRGAPWWI